MKKISSEKNFNVYLLGDYLDIKHCDLIVTKQRTENETGKKQEYFICSVALCYDNNELHIYKFDTGENYSAYKHNEYIEIIYNAVIKHYKLKRKNLKLW